MIDLLDVLLLMLFATACAWLWRGHGIRERALALAKQHCAKLDIELLDGNVAFRRLALVRDARGRAGWRASTISSSPSPASSA